MLDHRFSAHVVDDLVTPGFHAFAQACSQDHSRSQKPLTLPPCVSIPRQQARHITPTIHKNDRAVQHSAVQHSRNGSIADGCDRIHSAGITTGASLILPEHRVLDALAGIRRNRVRNVAEIAVRRSATRHRYEQSGIPVDHPDVMHHELVVECH
jgi:hypothetical protein